MDFYNEAINEYVKEFKSIKNFFIFTTNRCNSRCLTCNMYTKATVDLSVKNIKKIIDFAKETDGTSLYLTGGEFFLHPQYNEILSIANGSDYGICSNGILTKRIVEAVESHDIKKISFSLEGPKDIHNKVRGIDCFDSLMDTINAIKDRVLITLCMTVNPWNTYEDAKWVSDFCKENGFMCNFQYMEVIKYFETGETLPLEDYYYDVSDLLHRHSYIENFMNHYKGNIYLPCLNIREIFNVYSNGDIPLCLQNDKIILGNINDCDDLKEILHSERTKKLQEDNLTCNACWTNCHRAVDVKLFEFMEQKYGHDVLTKEFGEYKWPIA